MQRRGSFALIANALLPIKQSLSKSPIIRHPASNRQFGQMAEVSSHAPSVLSFNLSEDLLECLSHLEPADSTKAFALFEVKKDPPNPGICLKNGGPIGLPISEGDAKVFRAASYSSSLEKTQEVSISETVWVVPSDECEIKNPAWQPFLQDVVKKVSAGLCVDSTGKGVSAELFNISLYDMGSLSSSSLE